MADLLNRFDFYFSLFCVGLVLYIWGRRWLRAFFPVNDYEDDEEDIMSSTEYAAPQIAPSSLQTRPQTESDQTEDPKMRRAKLLDTYTRLRKVGMSRDDARALLKPWGIPLDNNLWAQAAPPVEEPQTITPIAGRPTSAQFHEDDPELVFQPPPR